MTDLELSVSRLLEQLKELQYQTSLARSNNTTTTEEVLFRFHAWYCQLEEILLVIHLREFGPIGKTTESWHRQLINNLTAPAQAVTMIGRTQQKPRMLPLSQELADKLKGLLRVSKAIRLRGHRVDRGIALRTTDMLSNIQDELNSELQLYLAEQRD